MTDDIIIRLRNHTYVLHGEEHVDPLAAEAADEIERLREQLRTTNGMLEAANYQIAWLAINLRDCRRGATRG